jgi:hypothetical protein
MLKTQARNISLLRFFYAHKKSPIKNWALELGKNIFNKPTLA